MNGLPPVGLERALDELLRIESDVEALQAGGHVVPSPVLWLLDAKRLAYRALVELAQVLRKAGSPRSNPSSPTEGGALPDLTTRQGHAASERPDRLPDPKARSDPGFQSLPDRGRSVADLLHGCNNTMTDRAANDYICGSGWSDFAALGRARRPRKRDGW